MRTILLFGDSNTHGTTPVLDLGASDRFPREERWATRLAGLLLCGVAVWALWHDLIYRPSLICE